MADCEQLPDISEYTDKYIKYPWMAPPKPPTPSAKKEEKQVELSFVPKTYEEALKILEPTRARPKWPGKTEYIDEYILRTIKDGEEYTTEHPIDMLTGRPRTPNDPYTVLTETQLKNLKKDPNPFFSLEGPKCGPTLVRPAPIDRYATNTSQYLFRDTPPRSHPHCWIDDQWQRDPPADHNTSRLGSTLRWGPSKTGERTISHFHKEDVHGYMNIDVYKRPPTNIPSMVVMKHGRPSEGYYQQRNPNFNTWFGSTHQLNETNVLTTIRPKTFAEYKQIKNIEQEDGKQRASKWPEISEYTDKFLINNLSETVPQGNFERMEKRKEFHREQRRLEAEALLKAQSETAPAPPAKPMAA